MSTSHRLCMLWIAGGLLALASPLSAGEAAEPAVGEVDELIARLGDDAFAVRERAQERLIEIGPEAYDAVKKATGSEDAEVARRAELILKAYDDQIDRLNAEAIRKARLWKRRLSAATDGPIRAAAGVVVYPAGAEKLAALDARTGKPRWSVEADTELGWAVHGETIYACDEDQRLRALNLGTGKAREGFEARRVHGPPTVRGDRLYVAGDEKLLILDRSSGKLLASHDLPGQAAMAPEVVEGAAFILTADGKCHRLDLDDGESRWSVAAGKKSLQALAHQGGRLFVRADEHLLALDPATGKQLWKYDVPQPATRAMIFAGVQAGADRLYVEPRPLAVSDEAVYLAGDDRVLAVAAEDGEQMWSHRPDQGKQQGDAAGGRGMVMVQGGVVRVQVVNGKKRVEVRRRRAFSNTMFSAPVLVDGVVYAGGKDGLVALSAADGRRLWRFATEEQVALRPAVEDGMVLFVGGRPRQWWQAGGARVVINAPGLRQEAEQEDKEPALYAILLSRLPATPAKKSTREESPDNETAPKPDPSGGPAPSQ